MTRLALLALALTIPACPPSPVPPTPEHRDAAPQPAQDGATCGDACECACLVLDRLGCPEALSTPKGITCPDVCRSVASVPTLSLNAECVAHARDIAQIRACGSVRCVP